MNAFDHGSKGDLESPSMIQKSFARNQPIITISGHQPSDEYLRYMGSLPSNKPMFKLRTNFKRYN